jgi:hypothetical protein
MTAVAAAQRPQQPLADPSRPVAKSEIWTYAARNVPISTMADGVPLFRASRVNDQFGENSQLKV